MNDKWEEGYSKLLTDEVIMNEQEFKKMYCDAFEVGERDRELYERVKLYFSATDDVSFERSQLEAKRFRQWWKERGYSQGDVNKVKRDIEHYQLVAMS